MRLEEITLNTRETMLLVVDIQRDFLEAEQGFAFFDAGGKENTYNMRAMVAEHLIPLIERSLAEKVQVAYVKSVYRGGTFQPPYDKLCSKAPGTDFYLIDAVRGVKKVKVFGKTNHDAFKNPGLGKYIQQKGIWNLVVAGVTLTTCVHEAIKSSAQIQGLKVILPYDCVSYREKKESEARFILERYASPQNTRVTVVNSGNIIYRK